MQRLIIHISGIVQGVGFRPFVYNLARRLGLEGWVLNNSKGVEIEIQGMENKVATFLQELQISTPPLAIIDKMDVHHCSVQEGQEFYIKKSEKQVGEKGWISPDVAVCFDCQQEMEDGDNRRHNYGFINCTNCGPRYSIIREIPYDRPKTTMAEFTMCPSCQAEYSDPRSRRFHAQPNACPVCGPEYRLLYQGQVVKTDDVYKETKDLIAKGNIIAIKGIGGYHLACDARNEQAVVELRRRKIREDKPFAVMCGSKDVLEQLCLVSLAEEKLLVSMKRPIVLLEKKDSYDLALGVAPGNAYLGAVLPYAPVHFLLMNPHDVWVMTSANVSDEPIAYEDQDAFERLATIADYFFVHNREIHKPCDDSVVRIFQDKQYLLRRSRGFAPAPIKISREMSPILAVGGEVKNTFCVTQGHFSFMSPHIGDLENGATYTAFLKSIEHYQSLFAVQPRMVAYDLHPEYISTKYALSLELPNVGVQHHHAHIASVLAEHGLQEKVIGVALDGNGYGSDGTLWGGEFLLADSREFIRLGHCNYLPLPGGVKAIKEPWRLGVWVLYNLYGREFTSINSRLAQNLPVGWQLMIDATTKNINAPLTSSAGRLFDVAASILGISRVIHYEGQAAVELELAAQKAQGQLLPYKIREGHPRILEFMPTFAALAEGVRKGESVNSLAASFHLTLAHAIVQMVFAIRQDTGVRTVALSGGVWQNMILLTKVVGMLQQAGFAVYTNQQVPTNDGGIALGQALVAATIQ